MPKVSIIIPTFNSEEFLRDTLDSVVNQTLKDIEIIVVDSISHDNTIPIVEEYMLRDSRIKLIKREKEWVSASRNAGMKKAIGDYIMFLDSDDKFEPNACEIAYNAIIERGSDILIFGDYIELPNKKIEPSWRVRYVQKCEKTGEKVDLLKLQMFIWNKIYKRSFLVENGIEMPADVKQAEDQVFNFVCEFYTDKYSWIDTPLIVYRQLREGASTTDIKGIIYDLDALKSISAMPVFQKQSLSRQLRIVDKFLECLLWNMHKWNSLELRTQIQKDAKTFLKFVESKYRKKDLNNISNYRKLKKTIVQQIMHYIFSLRNESVSHKVLTILGIKIKIRRV